LLGSGRYVSGDGGRPVPAGLKLPLKIIQQVSWPVVALLKAVVLSPILFNPFFRVLRQPRVIRGWAKQAYVNPTIVDDDLVDVLSQPAFDRGACRALVTMTQASKSKLDITAKVALPQLSVPLVLVWGKQDRFVPPSLGPLFTRCNPNLQLIELDQVGHCPQDEAPEQVNRVILDCLSNL
jgi:pimeloyl-ACP methyl ester carboxylesterase